VGVGKGFPRCGRLSCRKLGFIDYTGDLKVHSSLLSVILRD
jgi:hypothetical protein